MWVDYWGGKGYVGPHSHIIGGAWPPLAPPLPTPMWLRLRWWLTLSFLFPLDLLSEIRDWNVSIPVSCSLAILVFYLSKMNSLFYRTNQDISIKVWTFFKFSGFPMTFRPDIAFVLHNSRCRCYKTLMVETYAWNVVPVTTPTCTRSITELWEMPFPASVGPTLMLTRMDFYLFPLNFSLRWVVFLWSRIRKWLAQLITCVAKGVTS